MVRKISIQNFKSVQHLELELGRVNVFIGANGSGKSNILEAIAFGSAAAGRKLDNEFLASRGIRVSDAVLMRSAFTKTLKKAPIELSFNKFNLGNENKELRYSIQNDNKPYSKWQVEDPLPEWFKKIEVEGKINTKETKRDPIVEFETKLFKILGPFYNSIFEFLIYSPEESALRNFHSENQVEPLGIKGEGLFKLLKVFIQYDKSRDNDYRLIDELKSHLELIDWFEDFNISNGSFSAERFIQIKDQYLDQELAYFDQRSANEGFLFLLFYIALFISPDTPPFFAIDNIENALNPKLCSELVILLNKLSKKYGKQVIFTTHSPTVLDGLDLNDDEQRLFVIERNPLGHTIAHRIEKKPGQNGIKLSEAFVKGFIGGLPDNF